MAVKAKNSSMRTRTDKVRLGPLSVAQLEAIVQSSGTKKDKGKAQRRLLAIKKRS